jgi:thiopeptide-type bacteriocin biosynthesis protein
MFKIKNLFKEWYQPQESFVVRNPLFPIEKFFNWKAGSDNEADTSKEILRKSLREFYLQPLAQEALYIGSPDLHEQLLLWLDIKIDKPDKKEKLELSLVKYMIRMCTRCTPYGLFASCTVGNFFETTEIVLADKNSLQRHGRLDMDYVCELHSHLLKQKEICDQLSFYPNTSLYRIGDQWRYIEHRFRKETGRSYHLVEVDHSDYLEKIVLAAKEGHTVSELDGTISDDEVTDEEAREFIHELIYNQVLVDELQPTVTGEEFFSVVLHKLKNMQHTAKYVEQLEKVSEEFERLKNTDSASKNLFYQNIVQHLQQLDVPVHIKTLIQVDGYRSATCSINKKIAEELLKGASLLQLLTTDSGTKDSFADFKTAFINRYEGQWVPLNEVLDTESGIGYGKFATSGMEESPLIDKLPFNKESLKPQQQPDTESFKWQLYQQAISQNKTEVVIDDSLLEKFSSKEPSVTGLPDSTSMMVKINARSSEEVDKGNYTITLNSPSGPSGGNLLGRFCHLHPDIEKLTGNILEEEEVHRPDAVFAEIVHLPESRIGNILMRPVLRKYEIPYLCGTSLDKEFQIPVNDLLVGIQANRVVLCSKRLNKEVIPRLTTAHNFSMTTLPVYQFLCDLQFQNIRSIGWHWGILENRSFLPRVSYGKFIISKARWVLTKEDVKDAGKKNDEELPNYFTGIKKLKNLPDYVLLSQGDNELLLHLDNIFCLKLLLTEINKNESVILAESLDTPGSCWIKSPDGHHAAEFVFSFSNKKKEIAKTKDKITEPENIKHIQRFFPVSSEWLYAKIYCGTKTAEKILTDVIKPFTEELLSQKFIDKYFFLRYHDTGHHIRIRFHNARQVDFWKELIYLLKEKLQPYMSTQQVYNLQFETYQREVERYGFDTMHLSEDIFFHQSKAVLNFISMLQGDEGEQYRWQVALKAIDLFLDAFNYTIEQKKDLIEVLDRSFGEEFNIKSAEQKKISERFSTHKQLVQSVMNGIAKENEDLGKAISVFEVENKIYKKCIEEILNTPSINREMEKLNRIMPAFLHMFINRLFVSNQRKTELVIYDYLFRYYESKIAREKKANPIRETIKVTA